MLRTFIVCFVRKNGVEKYTRITLEENENIEGIKHISDFPEILIERLHELKIKDLDDVYIGEIFCHLSYVKKSFKNASVYIVDWIKNNKAKWFEGQR